VCHNPHLAGVVGHKPQMPASRTWGTCATTPIWRGLCATTPKTPALLGGWGGAGRGGRGVGVIGWGEEVGEDAGATRIGDGGVGEFGGGWGRECG
jgi:hypothetical protein